MQESTEREVVEKVWDFFLWQTRNMENHGPGLNATPLLYPHNNHIYVSVMKWDVFRLFSVFKVARARRL